MKLTFGAYERSAPNHKIIMNGNNITNFVEVIFEKMLLCVCGMSEGGRREVSVDAVTSSDVESSNTYFLRSASDVYQ
jgi:hypothetical protein